MQGREDRGPRPKISKLGSEVYEAIVRMHRDDRDATVRRIAAYLTKAPDDGKLQGKALDLFHEEHRAQARAIVEIGLRELRKKRMIKQVIDAWVPLYF